MWYVIAEYYPPSLDGLPRERLGSYWGVLSGGHTDRDKALKHGNRLWRTMHPSTQQGVPELIRIKVVERSELHHYGLSDDVRTWVGLQSSFLEPK